VGEYQIFIQNIVPPSLSPDRRITIEQNKQIITFLNCFNFLTSLLTLFNFSNQILTSLLLLQPPLLWKLPLPQNISDIGSCVSSLVAFTGFKRPSKYSLHLDRISFLSLQAENVARRILMEELGNSSWIFCHANDGLFAKNSWNPTDNRLWTPPRFIYYWLPVPKLQLFAPQCTGIANQMMTCSATRPWMGYFWQLYWQLLLYQCVNLLTLVLII